MNMRAYFEVIASSGWRSRTCESGMKYSTNLKAKVRFTSYARATPAFRVTKHWTGANYTMLGDWLRRGAILHHANLKR